MPVKGRANVDKAMSKLKMIANDDIRGVYLSGLSAMINQSPVDDGGARNNWFFTGASPDTSSERPPNKSGSASKRSLSEMPKIVLGKKFFFTNNLPYIINLEYGGYPNPVKKGTYIKKSKSYEIRSTGGFSKQIAPDGWVRKTLTAMRNKIRQL